MDEIIVVLLPCPVCGELHPQGSAVVFLSRRCRQRFDRLPPNRQRDVLEFVVEFDLPEET
jgi:hypothetical protein